MTAAVDTVLDGVSVPDSWTDFYRIYKPYISKRLYQLGFPFRAIDDETSSIITRLIERHYLSASCPGIPVQQCRHGHFDPTKGKGGRTIKFRTFLTETVNLTVRGALERERLRSYREPYLASFAQSEECDDDVCSVLRSRFPVSDFSVEGFLFDPARSTVELIRVRLVAEQSELLPLFVALEADSAATETTLSRRLAQPRELIRDQLVALREFAAGVRALAAYQRA